MKSEENTRICPVEKAGILNNSLRKLLQNPKKILGPFIQKGMTVLDYGCGPGFFTLEIASLVGNDGKVIAADLQEGMLEKVKQKITETNFANRILLHKCKEDSIDLIEKVDFVLAFWVVHEVPNQEKLFNELKSILKSNGQILVVEPKFHVKKNEFEAMVDKVRNFSFQILKGPKVFISRTVMIKNEM